MLEATPPKPSPTNMDVHASSVEKASCNSLVVEMLREQLAEAEKGQVSFGAVVTVEAPNIIRGAVQGSGYMEEHALEGVEFIRERLKATVHNRTVREIDPDLDASWVCYQAATAPISFDVITWLVEATMIMRREGAPGPLKVGFWLGRDGKTGVGTPARRRAFDNVVRAALPLIGAVEDNRAILGRAKHYYASRDIVAAYKAGEELPKLRSVSQRKLPPGTVTITLRETDEWPHRNSNLPAWVKFAGDLKAKGYRPLFLRDTAKAFEPIDGFETYPRGSIELDARMAAYESADANLLVGNGPVHLCLYSDAPYLEFHEVEPDGHKYTADTPEFWRDHYGVELGGQYPWSKPTQRIVWEPDNYATISEAFERYFGNGVRLAAAE